MKNPVDLVGSEQYQLDRLATELKKAGDWDGAINALRRRKALLGDLWVDDKLAKYLQEAGRFDESMSEIQWLLSHSQQYVRRMLGHQPVSVQQAQHAGRCARLHASAVLICKKGGESNLQAQHEQLAQRYGAIRERLEPIARAERKARINAMRSKVQARVKCVPQ